jgi:hypothetical protein
MILAIDFDGTVVKDDRPYNDIWSPLELQPGAREALLSLKRAGHTLVLWSGRSNRASINNPTFNPLWIDGLPWPSYADRVLHANRFRQMKSFVEKELPGIFDAIDDGRQGKLRADKYIDDRAIQLGGPGGTDWATIAETYGE